MLNPGHEIALFTFSELGTKFPVPVWKQNLRVADLKF
jgi:hypothetical protein